MMLTIILNQKGTSVYADVFAVLYLSCKGGLCLYSMNILSPIPQTTGSPGSMGMREAWNGFLMSKQASHGAANDPISEPQGLYE